MTTWVALLRGINVGGHAPVPMAELRELCVELGFEEVRTYIQSGNVVFRSDGDRERVRQRLVRGIQERFGHQVPVVARTADELEEVVDTHPFAREGHDEKTLHVGFLEVAPGPAVVAALPEAPPGPERFRVQGAHVHLHYPEGVGRSKLTGAWFERGLGTRMTMRNWRTVNRLLGMAREG